MIDYVDKQINITKKHNDIQRIKLDKKKIKIYGTRKLVNQQDYKSTKK